MYISIYLKNENTVIHSDNFKDLKEFLTMYQNNKQVIAQPNNEGEYILFGCRAFKEKSVKLSYDEMAYMQKRHFIYDSKNCQLLFEYKNNFYHYIYDITNLTTQDIDYSLFNSVFTYKGLDLLNFSKGFTPSIKYCIDKYRIFIGFDENYNHTSLNIFEPNSSQPIYKFFEILQEYEKKVKPYLPALMEFLNSSFKPETIYI